MDNERLWRATLGELEVILTKANFTTWFKDSFIVEVANNEVIIGVPNSFIKEWIEKKYSPQVESTLKKLRPETKIVKYKVSAQVDNLIAPLPTKVSSPIQTRSNNIPSNLNKQYIFNTFIVGNSNRLAYATSEQVSQKPGTTYNPLFIYGGVGLGKTHLIQAIGNEIYAKQPEKKVVYVSCEKFTNDFINSISNGKINDFKKNYRDVDVFLVDDIQFLSKKEGTQEEFFHTFNALHQKNRQIVITSDRVPKAIPDLEERLSSRFGWGMVADIQPPNFETRVAIISQKCKEKNHQLSDELINYLAQNIQTNIRDLEGALIRITTYCQLNNIKPSLQIATNLLDNMINVRTKNISAEKILKIVGIFYNLPVEEIISPKRNKEIMLPRQVSMYLLRYEINLSFPAIGNVLGKRDHTTIMHGCDKIEKEIIKNNSLQKDLNEIKERLYAL
jgi:chromosomal replication initiator protein